MKHLSNHRGLVLFILLIPFITSCEKEPDDFSNSEPVTYYLSYQEALSQSALPDGGWLYISNYIYPSGVTSCEWSVHLTHNISRGEFGYDLLFWSATQTMVRIDFILKEGTQETVLASKDLSIQYISDQTAIHHHVELETNPLTGTNPESGKDGELIFRITHISGTDSVEVLFDANTGMMGCTFIAVYEDM